MCRPKGLGFLRLFGLKKGTDSAHFSLESGMVLEGAAPHPPPRIPRSSPPSPGGMGWNLDSFYFLAEY